jgi:hypothetical protein
MFYISSQKGDKFGVTNTDTNEEIFYTDSQIARILEQKQVHIYGTNYYNYKANCTPISLNVKLSKSELEKLLKNWKSVHNQWSGRPVADYLAQARIGTKIEVDYSYTGDGDRSMHNGVTIIGKLSLDQWKWDDTDSIFAGAVGDSIYAARALEIACIASHRYTVKLIK